MVKYRNSLGQYSSSDYLTIRIPGPAKLFKLVLILLIFAPWFVILLYRINLREIFEAISGFKLNEEGKKSNGFF